MTYLELVNNVLARLRESSVASVSTNDYSALIGKFVNDAKRQVEDAWDWDALTDTLELTTAIGSSGYTLADSGRRHRKVTVNIENETPVRNVPIKWILDQQQLSPERLGTPVYYAWNGTDGTNSQLEFFPTPDRAYTLYFNGYFGQPELEEDDDVIWVQTEAVIAGAYARALVERGEDGGLSSSEAYGLYRGILADLIAIESSRYVENECWLAT